MLLVRSQGVVLHDVGPLNNKLLPQSNAVHSFNLQIGFKAAQLDSLLDIRHSSSACVVRIVLVRQSARDDLVMIAATSVEHRNFPDTEVLCGHRLHSNRLCECETCSKGLWESDLLSCVSLAESPVCRHPATSRLTRVGTSG